MENIIYLYFDQSSSISRKDQRSIRKDINKTLRENGLETRAAITRKLPNAGDLDNTDTFAFIGDGKALANIDGTRGFDQLRTDGDYEQPESASAPGLIGIGEGKAGNLILVNSDFIRNGLSYNEPLLKGITPEEIIAGVIPHGAGHNAGLAHSDLWPESNSFLYKPSLSHIHSIRPEVENQRYSTDKIHDGNANFNTSGPGMFQLARNDKSLTFKSMMGKITSGQKAIWQGKFGTQKAKRNFR